MPAVATPLPLEINELLLDAVCESVPKALSMCGTKARCVGVSRMPAKQEGEVTGMIGVHGDVSGFIAVNASSRLALHLVEGLVGDKSAELTPQVIDGAGEVTNIIIGGVKAALAGSEWAFSQITVPSVIVGDGYQVAYASGNEVLDVTFECQNEDAIFVNDRTLHVTLSLLKL